MKIKNFPLLWLTFGIFAIYLPLSQLIASNVATRLGSDTLKTWANSLGEVSVAHQKNLAQEALHRIEIYESLIKKHHLVDGMIVNRSLITRSATAVCDSLLFSAIRFAALNKLKMQQESLTAWRAIEQSRKSGYWLRHPRCAGKSLSRDMLTGVLLALRFSPPRSKEYLQSLVYQLDQKSGYFSNGPVYVSYLTPGLGKIIRLLGDAFGLEVNSFPDVVKQGYSTNEFSVILIQPGYEAHLAGLALWLEMEIDESLHIQEKPGYLDHIFNALVRPFSKGDLKSQSFSWTSRRLFEIDPKNLFFTYLRLRAAGVLSPKTALLLLQKLLLSTEFPAAQLPSDCDRDVDYLWQRNSVDFKSRAIRCNEQFAGVDFIWMASLLLAELEWPMVSFNQ